MIQFKSLSLSLHDLHYLEHPPTSYLDLFLPLIHTFLYIFYSKLSVLLQDVSYWKSICHAAGNESFPLSSFSPPGRPRGFKLRLPLLRSLSNSKVSLDDAEAGHIPTATPLPLHPDHHSHESVGLAEFLPVPPLPPDHQQQITGSR